MNFCCRRKIKNLAEAYLNGRKHDKWISRVGRYYREVLQNPGKTEIYLQELLKYSLFDNNGDGTVPGVDEIVFEYSFLPEEEKAGKKGNIKGKLKYFFKGCASELEKYGRIISHRKK